MSKIIFKAKNEVARKHGFADWENIENSEMDEIERNELKVTLIEEIAETTLELLIENLPTDEQALRQYKIANECWQPNEFKDSHNRCLNAIRSFL